MAIEEHRAEIAAAWKTAVTAELGGDRADERALEFAAGPLLRELGLALRAGAPPPRSGPDARERCAVLVRAAATAPRIAREWKLLHRALWDVLRASGQAVSPEDRRVADEWLDEALACALDRLERLRVVAPLAAPSELVTRPGAPGAAPRGRPAAPPPPKPPPLPWVRERTNGGAHRPTDASPRSGAGELDPLIH
jgi:hypothetical protein